jgi:hypothetical protein
MKHLFAVGIWAVLLAGQIANAQTIPSFAGANLADEKVQLPSGVSGSKTVLVIGFSKKSGDACRPWFQQVASQLKDKPQINYYQLPVLTSAPGFIRGSIIHSMRNDMPPEQRKHFIPITDHEKEWKNAAGFSAPDDPYVLIVDEHGSVLWRNSGAWSQGKQQELQAALARL